MQSLASRCSILLLGVVGLSLATGCGNPAPTKSTTSGTGGVSVASSTSGGPASASSGTSSGQSCTNACQPGSRQCDGTQVQTCAGPGINGCYAWSEGITCPGGGSCISGSCQGGSSTSGASSSGSTGTTGTSCTNQCPADGATQCAGAQVEICHSDNGCLVLSVPESCPTGQACGGSNATCVSQGNTTGATATGTTGGTTTTSSSSGTTGGCMDQCQSGETQCSGAQVEDCATGTDGCLEWQPASACPSGESCDPVLNACEAICDVSQTQTDCNQAASVIEGCCAGGVGTLTGSTLCAQELNAQRDPDSECQGLASESCSQLEAAYEAIGTCCCPSGEYCNEETSAWTCTPTCQDNADCSAYASTTACCPNDNGSEIVYSDFICKSDNGAAYHGCTGDFTSCSNPYDCWSAPGGEYCTLSCNQDSDCGDPSACCDTSGVTCSNLIDSCDANSACNGSSCAGACLPCGLF